MESKDPEAGAAGDSPELLFGVLAVQLGFASPSQVMAVAAAWTADAGRGLAERLEAEGVLSAERRRVLEAMVAEALRQAGGDVRLGLQSFGGGGGAAADVRGVGGADA